MTHVLFVTGEYPPMQGGVGAYTRELGCALHALGVRVSVLTSHRAAQPNCAEFDSCIRVLPAIEKWDWRIWQTVPELARELKADWVHVQYQTAAFAMHPAINFAPARWQRQIPCVAWTYHDLLPMYLFPKAGRRLRTWVTERPAHSGACVITTTVADRETLVSHRATAVTIPIGSNVISANPSPEERRTRRTQRGYGDHDLVIGFFGFLNQSKGGLDLVKTVHQLSQQRGAVQLLMIGDKVGASDQTNHAYFAEIEAKIRQYDLAARVHWTGAEPDADVAADLNACDVLLLPFTDGVSLRRGTLMAALANGCAIVTTTPQGPFPELVHERDLLYVPVGDSAAMAAAVTRLAQDAPLRTLLQANARRASQQFGWDAIARRHVELYAAGCPCAAA